MHPISVLVSRLGRDDRTLCSRGSKDNARDVDRGIPHRQDDRGHGCENAGHECYVGEREYCGTCIRFSLFKIRVIFEDAQELGRKSSQ